MCHSRFKCQCSLPSMSGCSTSVSPLWSAQQIFRYKLINFKLQSADFTSCKSNYYYFMSSLSVSLKKPVIVFTVYLTPHVYFQSKYVNFYFWLSVANGHVESTGSRPITEVKQRRARLVLGWVTSWEHRVLLATFFFFFFSSFFLLLLSVFLFFNFFFSFCFYGILIFKKNQIQGAFTVCLSLSLCVCVCVSLSLSSIFVKYGFRVRVLSLYYYCFLLE